MVLRTQSYALTSLAFWHCQDCLFGSDSSATKYVTKKSQGKIVCFHKALVAADQTIEQRGVGSIDAVIKIVSVGLGSQFLDIAVRSTPDGQGAAADGKAED
jgi:hypothetical protein